MTVTPLGGCATTPANPSFDVSAHEARRALGEMRSTPRALDRPVVVLDGLGLPGASWLLAPEVRRVTGDRRVIGVTFAFADSFEECRRRLVDAVEERFPCDDRGATREVDVIAVSMGGVVARYAAAPPPGARGKRLRVARIFSISSPHRGAAMADLPLPLGRLQRDLRTDSRFLRELAARERAGAYELYPYVRLGDAIVGEGNATPAGVRPLWLPNLFLEGAHLTCWTDPRILADIARRLRGETPFAVVPGRPLPGG